MTIKRSVAYNPSSFLVRALPLLGPNPTGKAQNACAQQCIAANMPDYLFAAAGAVAEQYAQPIEAPRPGHETIRGAAQDLASISLSAAIFGKMIYKQDLVGVEGVVRDAIIRSQDGAHALLRRYTDALHAMAQAMVDQYPETTLALSAAEATAIFDAHPPSVALT